MTTRTDSRALRELRDLAAAQGLRISVREREGSPEPHCVAYEPEPPFDADTFFSSERCAASLSVAIEDTRRALEIRYTNPPHPAARGERADA